MSRTKTPQVVQRFSDEYLERCRKLSPQDIVRFLEDYRKFFGVARQIRDSQEYNASDSHKTTQQQPKGKLTSLLNRKTVTS